MIVALAAGLGWQPSGLAGGVITGLFIGLCELLIGQSGWLSSGELQAKTFPNQGIRLSARNALGVGLAIGVPVGLVVGLLGGLSAGTFSGLLGGLLGWLCYGGRTYLQHLVLRLLLLRNGAAPWHYAKFLDYTSGRIFLRRIGGGYIFIHRLLQDYFAARYTDMNRGTYQDPAERGPSTPS